MRWSLSPSALVVASLSLATDLATGHPIEHGLRRCLLAVWLGEALELDATELSDAYYVALLKGDQIRLAARIFQVAHDADTYHRIGESETAVNTVRRRSGSQYDPDVAGRFCEIAEPLLRRMESEPVWDAAISAEPAPLRGLSCDELSIMGRAIARFVDLRSPFTLGHSTGVAMLAEETARRLGLSEGEVVTLRHAGYLHTSGDSACRWRSGTSRREGPVRSRIARDDIPR